MTRKELEALREGIQKFIESYPYFFERNDGHQAVHVKTIDLVLEKGPIA